MIRLHQSHAGAGARCAIAYPEDASPGHVVVAHEDMTARKLAEHEMVRFNEHLKHRLGRTKALRLIDTAITAGRDPRHTLALVVEQAIDQLGVDAADILPFDEVAGTLELAAGKGIAFDGELRAGARSASLARRVAHAGLPLHVANLRNAPEADPRVCLLLDQGFKAYETSCGRGAIDESTFPRTG